MSPEEIGAFVASVLMGAGGVIATQKLHAKLQPSSSNNADEKASAMLAVVERIEGKIDRLGGTIRGVQVDIEAISEEQRRHGHDLSRLNKGYLELGVRVEALERRSQFPT